MAKKFVFDLHKIKAIHEIRYKEIEKIQSWQELFFKLLALLVRSIELRQVVEISGSFK